MEYRLEELCNISSSKRIYRKEYQQTGIPFYRGKEIIQKANNIPISDKLYISTEKYNEIEQKYGVPHKGDILITAVGTIGVSYLVKDERFYFKDGNLIWIKDFDKKVDNEYLFIYLNSLKFKNELEKIAIGSTQRAITIIELKKIKINLPSIEIQKKMVKIYKGLDKKIELNNQINNNLYKITSKLYEHIFITNRSEEWKEYALMDIANIQNGYSYKGTELVEESKIGMATIKNFDRTGVFKEDGFKPLKPLKDKDELYAKKFDVLVACTDLTQNADIIGNTVMLLSKNGYDKVIISMDLVKVVPKLEYINNYMLYSILSSSQFKNFALGYTSGTTVLHLNKNCFKEFSIKLPDKIEIAKFVKTVEPMYLRISEIIEENKTLEKLRDTLLSKLMNGEINLDNIKI